MNRTFYVCDSCGASSSLITSPAESGRYLCPFCGKGNLVLNVTAVLDALVNRLNTSNESLSETVLTARYGKPIGKVNIIEVD